MSPDRRAVRFLPYLEPDRFYLLVTYMSVDIPNQQLCHTSVELGRLRSMFLGRHLANFPSSEGTPHRLGYFLLTSTRRIDNVLVRNIYNIYVDSYSVTRHRAMCKPPETSQRGNQEE